MTIALIDFATCISVIAATMTTLFVLWRADHNSRRRLEEELYEARAAVQFATLLAGQPGLEFLRSWQRDDEKELHASYPPWRAYRERYVRFHLKLKA